MGAFDFIYIDYKKKKRISFHLNKKEVPHKKEKEGNRMNPIAG